MTAQPTITLAILHRRANGNAIEYTDSLTQT